jgi:hypothetical protein
MALLNFDSTNVKPLEANEPIPAGWYMVHMTASKMKPTEAGDGAYLACEFTVLEGQFTARKLFTNLNLQNKNPAAQEIAYRALSAICHAVGVIQVADSAQLHNRPLQIKVSLRPAGLGGDGKNYEASNEVKGYRSIQAGAVAPATAIPQGLPPVTQQAPAASVTVPPAAQAAPAWAAAPAPVVAAPVVQAAPAAAIPVAASTPPWATPPTA